VAQQVDALRDPQPRGQRTQRPSSPRPATTQCVSAGESATALQRRSSRFCRASAPPSHHRRSGAIPSSRRSAPGLAPRGRRMHAVVDHGERRPHPGAPRTARWMRDCVHDHGVDPPGQRHAVLRGARRVRLQPPRAPPRAARARQCAPRARPGRASVRRRQEHVGAAAPADAAPSWRRRVQRRVPPSGTPRGHPISPARSATISSLQKRSTRCPRLEPRQRSTARAPPRPRCGAVVRDDEHGRR
jgi:hypothetical protein